MGPSPLLRLMLRLTQRLTPGCTITVSATLLIPMAMGTTDMGWAMLVWGTMAMAIIWVMLDTTATTSATTARGRPRLNLMLPQRLIPGCTIAMLVTGSIHTDMGTTGMGWDMLPMLDITPTLTSEAAEMATEPW